MASEVLGAGRWTNGLCGCFRSIRSPRVEQVILADNNLSKLQRVAEKLGDSKITPVELDIAKSKDVLELMSRSTVAIGCVSYEYNYVLAKLALEARCHFVDLGGNEEMVAKEFLLNDLAKEQGVTIIPDLGLAPGLVSILAVSAAESLDQLYEIKLRVGGLPVEPEGPLNYSQVFSIDGLINEYYEDVTLIRDGRLMTLPSLTEVESIEFPKPFGTLEAFTTSGGASTLPQSYEGKIQHLNYKTIRYRGHCEQIALLKDLGLMDSEPLSLRSGVKVSPESCCINCSVTNCLSLTPMSCLCESP